MVFDVIEITYPELQKLSVIQMQLLRTAQKRKNELRQNLEDNIAAYRRLALGNNMINSSLVADKTAQLTEVYERELEILVEQLKYSMELNAPLPDDHGSSERGYIVDYTLSYNERFAVVRNYYLSLPDPVERLALYEKDDVAKRYLDSYYTTLWSLLYEYSKV